MLFLLMRSKGNSTPEQSVPFSMKRVSGALSDIQELNALKTEFRWMHFVFLFPDETLPGIVATIGEDDILQDEPGIIFEDNAAIGRETHRHGRFFCSGYL